MNTQTIYVHKTKDDPFARVPKAVLDDPSLSWKAKGVLAYILGKPKDWKVMVADICNRGTDGEAAVRTALKELRVAGYAKLEKVTNAGKVVEWILKVSDSAVFSQPEPDGDFLHLENPDVEKPDVENRQHTKNEVTKNEVTETENTNTGELSLGVTKGKKPFQKPTLEEVKFFCQQAGILESDAVSTFWKWEGNGWVNGKQPIKDWKATFRSWHAAGYLPSQRNSQQNGSPVRKKITAF